MLGWLFKILSIDRKGVNRRAFLQTTLAAGAALTIPDLLAKSPAPTPATATAVSTLILEPNLHPRHSFLSRGVEAATATRTFGTWHPGRFGLRSNIERIPRGDVPRKEEAAG